jgi:hypothetical protein
LRHTPGVAYGDLKLDPDCDPLRGDPRFAALVAKVFAPKKEILPMNLLLTATSSCLHSLSNHVLLRRLLLIALACMWFAYRPRNERSGHNFPKINPELPGSTPLEPRFHHQFWSGSGVPGSSKRPGPIQISLLTAISRESGNNVKTYLSRA